MSEIYKPELPQEPQDGFELVYFSIALDCVQEVRLRYHVNTKWSDIAASKGGADLIDQWQVLVNNHFSGRMDGWAAPLTNNHDDHFPTHQAATNTLCRRLQDRAEAWEERARGLRDKCAALEAEKQQ